ncbi:hypothetical protein [Streptomyces sp. NPDC093097]|uniref:hypothetical protein n=1 Tax=Streptomyces sp. NPDC093097 TaxID=3366027 RepID=UPI0037F85B97
MLAARGLDVEFAEPPLGTTVRIGRRTWRRMADGWSAQDQYRGNNTMTWAQIYHRFGPHNITTGQARDGAASPNT